MLAVHTANVGEGSVGLAVHTATVGEGSVRLAVHTATVGEGSVGLAVHTATVGEGSVGLAVHTATATKHILLFGTIIDLTFNVKFMIEYGTADAGFHLNGGMMGRIRVEINNKRKTKRCI